MGVQSLEALPGKLSAALGRVNLFTAELLKLFYSHDNGGAVPACGQQIAGAIRGDVDAIAPASTARSEEAVKLPGSMFDGITFSVFWIMIENVRHASGKSGCFAAACIAGKNQL